MERRSLSSISYVAKLMIIITIILAFPPTPATAAGTCGTGTWIPGTLEIHHINIGQGDAALIVSPTGKSLLFDAGESTWNSSTKAQIIGPYITSVLGCKALDYVVISHFHLDHIGYVGYGGLWNLVESQGFTVGTTLVRDYSNYLGDISATFTNWKNYLAGLGQAKLHPITVVEGTSQVNLGSGVIFNIIAADGNGAVIAGDFHGNTSPPSENDYSIGAVLSYGDFDEWMGGDLDGQFMVSGFGYSYHDIELSTAHEVGDVDVYKANHHGSSHSSSATFINQLDPEVSIITVGNSNMYGHPDQTVMNRLLATSTVYLTERGNTNTNIGSAIVAGNIVIKTTDGTSYTVNGTHYAATEPVRTDVDGDGYFAEADPNDGSFSTVPSPSGGCDPLYQTCAASITSCQVTAGQVLINEVLPSPSNNGTEWMELYNTTSSPVNIGYCIIDDIPGASTAYQIPASTFIPAHGFWTLDQISYFNNAGDSVRFLKEDASTILDNFSYGSTPYDVSWVRIPDGGPWAGSTTASTTKGNSNTGAATTTTLSVSKTGTGSGTVTSNPAGINCGSDCSEIYAGNTQVTLSATPAAGSYFAGWSGACAGTGSCVVSMTADKTVTATFKLKEFNPISQWTTDFNATVQGWRVDKHPRMLGDVNGDGKDDVVGFFDDGVWVGRSNGSGTAFNAMSQWSTGFSYNQGWRVEQHVRTVGDVNGDGQDDVVGFFTDGVWIALSNGSSFGSSSKWSSSFTFNQGWRVDQHPLTVGDVNGDGKDDLIGFGYDGVWVALSNGSSFGSISKWGSSFTYNQGWRIAQHPRLAADVNGDGNADLIGFGYDGVWVSLSNGSGFATYTKWGTSFTYNQGWRVNQHPRTAADVNGDGNADLIGFGYDGVWVALSNGTGFDPYSMWTDDFNYSVQGWRVEQHPRMAGDVSGDGKADLVGFGNYGVWIATAK